jgi:triosephosphate isomerase
MSAKLVIANFKSHKNRTEFESWLTDFESNQSKLLKDVHIILAPSFPNLSLFADKLGEKKLGSSISLAVQDLSSFPAGAYTGAVSTRNLDGFGVTYAILGHSERRRYFHETEMDVASKVREAIDANISPLVCVTASDIGPQAAAMDDTLRSKVSIVFEPIEAIGTGKADDFTHVKDIQKRVSEAFGPVPFLYGGSVGADTDPRFFSDPTIAGFLVGTTSLEVDSFMSLVTTIAHAK